MLRNPSYLISATLTFVSILILLFAALMIYHIWLSLTKSKRTAQWASLATMAFGLPDWILLNALPHLGLSFGPVGPPLLLITGLRSLFSILLIWTWKRLGKRWIKLASIKGTFLCCVLLWLGNLGILFSEIYGLYIEPFKLQVTKFSISTPIKLPGNHFRIVQLSDLHIERTTKREIEVLEKIKALTPDIIVLTGDYLNTSYTDDPTARRDARWLFKQLKAPYGVYAVTAKGVDPPDAVSEMFSNLDITLLQDEVQMIELGKGELYILGISYIDLERDRQILPKLLKQVPEDAYAILLYHTPDMAVIAAEENVDFYLAGHTHGGQIRLPIFGAILTASVYWKKYEQGLYKIGETTLYVNRGIGMEGRGAPRVRFLCPPEIVVVDLNPISTNN